MRKTITISVSEDMYELVYEGARKGFHSSVSDYIRTLVRGDIWAQLDKRIMIIDRSKPKRARDYLFEDLSDFEIHSSTLEDL